MKRLEVETAIMGRRRLTGDEPCRMKLRCTVGEHGLDQLIVGYGTTRHEPVSGEIQARFDEPSGGTAASGGDHQALAAEPGIGEGHAVAFAADAVGDRHPNAFESNHRVMVVVGMGIGRRSHDAQARRLGRAEEQAHRSGIGPVAKPRLTMTVSARLKLVTCHFSPESR
jgi:hypothetical protein